MLQTKSILSDLYYGKISPWESSPYKTAKTNKSIEKFKSEKQALFAVLPDDTHKLVDEFLETDLELRSAFEEETFKKGFVLGAKIMIETLNDNQIEE